MKAVVVREFQARPLLETVPDPMPSPGGVVIRVAATGLCRSDWHGWMGHDKDVTLPHVPGHELAGVVEETGRDVTGWRPGDRVTLPFVCGCGSCPQCRSGNQQVCHRQFQPGFTRWGSFAELVAVDYADVNLVRLPAEVSDVAAASLGCRFVTSFRAVVDRGRAKPGEWVAVHGCGGVGLSAVMIANALGARVVAIDITDEKLALAKTVGAEVLINASGGQKVAPAIRQATGGGAHLSLDALGSPILCGNSIRCLRKRGRHVQVGLLVGEEANAAVPMDLIVAYELEILGSHGIQAHRYDALLGMIRAGRLRPDLLVGRTMSLEESIDQLVRMNEFPETGIQVIHPLF